jgi:hypothetical protein
MPSEIAHDIVNHIFSDNKADAMDLVKDAISSHAYELIQQRKLEIAKTMGFDLGDTAQEVADDLEDNLAVGDESPEDYEFDGRLPHDPPEITDEEETDETDS